MGYCGEVDKVDLNSFGLASGQGAAINGEVRVEPVKLGGQEYVAEPEPVNVRIDVSRTLSGFAMRLRCDTELVGVCMRCLEPATVKVAVDAREVDQPGTGDAELESPYVDLDELDVTAWTRDAIVLGSPSRILCREDCAGLCPTCGESLNDAPEGAHDHGPKTDPRWAALKEIRFE